MGLALLALIWLITFVSTYFFVAKTWWLPVGASAAAALIDRQFTLTFIIMGVVFVAAQLALGYIVWKYRETSIISAGRLLARQHNDGSRLDGSDRHSVYRAEPDGQPRVGEPSASMPPRPEPVQVEVTGHAVCLVLPLSRSRREIWRDQSEADGSVGGRRSRGGTGYLAIRRPRMTSSPARCICRSTAKSTHLRAVDVIHSFFVPNCASSRMRCPGLNIHMHFTPTAIGDYEIACAELCGLGHYKMHGMVKVVSQEDFDKWLAAREAEKQ